MNFLEQIIAYKKAEIQELKKYSFSFYEHEIAKNNLSFFSFSSVFSQNKQNHLHLIAEIKKASPSKGIIREIFNPVELAQEFQNKGASALSVLTEEYFFLGKPEYLRQIKEKVTIPLLKKDFHIDPIQLYQAKMLGADAVLLIKALLSVDECQQLLDLAEKLALDVLLEIHSLAELSEIRKLSNLKFIGVNNRNLKTFQVDPNLAFELFSEIKKIFPQVKIIAESSYKEKSELEKLAMIGFNGVLIGEGLAINPSLFEVFSSDKVNKL